MKEHKTHRNCPVCNSTTVNLVKEITFSLFDKHPMANGYTVVQCTNCGFVFADTGVTQKDLDIYYKDLSKYEDKTIGTGGGFTAYDKDRLVKAATFISENFPDKSIRIADIGCANGGLLKELKNLGFTNLVGIDPSSACIDITATEVGCDCYQYSIFDISTDVGKFDLIILSHVLEHILELSSTLEMLDTLLNEHGSVYAECPNAQNYSEVIHAPYQEFNTEHINHFNELAFENLFGLHSFIKIYTGDKITQIASGQDYHSVYGIFRKQNNLNYNVVFDKGILESLLVYLQKSEVIYTEIIKELENVEANKIIALYGIGQFAFKLLAEPVLKNRKCLLFDNNSLNVGKSINGVNVIHGKNITNSLPEHDVVIIITSIIHEKDIKANLRERFDTEGMIAPEILAFKHLLSESTT